MTLELVIDAPPSPVATLLEELLDHEWATQSHRTAPLQPTTTVRELVELALATTPGGIFAASVPPAASPHALVEHLHDALPDELSPWTRRAMRHATSLRPPQPTLPPAQATPLLDPPPPDATVVEPDATPAASPEIPAPAPEIAPVAAAASPEIPAAAPEIAPVAPSRRSRPLTLAAGVALGAAVGGAAMLVSAPELAVGAVAGLVGVVVGRSG